MSDGGKKDQSRKRQILLVTTLSAVAPVSQFSNCADILGKCISRKIRTVCGLDEGVCGALRFECGEDRMGEG